jgi:hypothetical protein
MRMVLSSRSKAADISRVTRITFLLFSKSLFIIENIVVVAVSVL